ncbi:hypothetical protein EDC01DRAFT_636020 [Geopyxis carbonaria]|nr:hypothetical protein EDC01DRAFT_636020 [Geopyxis carbonaria]
MSAPYAYHNSPPPRGISPATHINARAASQSPRQSPYNPAIYQGPNGGPFARRPSASPMRGITATAEQDPEQYNPQSFGPVSGNGGAFVPSTRNGDEALFFPAVSPPPYSPPNGARNQPLHVDPSHRRQSSWPHSGSNPASPESAGVGPTPSTGTRAAFSPYSATASSTANTTPLSPGESGSWFSSRRRYSPTSQQQQQYAPTTPSALNQPSYPSSPAPAVAPASVRNPSAPPRTVGNVVPPPPPGPPPASHRSASVSAGPSAVMPSRSHSRPRAIQIPPPPQGPPPQRTGSLRRAAAGMASAMASLSPRHSPASPSPRQRSFSQPMTMSPTEESVPPVPPLPPAIPPKRKIEEEATEETPYRDKQRASPKQVEEEIRMQREGSVDNTNNPYRNGVSKERERGVVSPPRLSPTMRHVPEEPEKSPLIDLTSPDSPHYRGRDSAISMEMRRKPVSPTLTTPRQQLPTPPPQLVSPTTPGPTTQPGPSKPRDLGKGVAQPEMGFLDLTRRRYREMLIAEDAVASPSKKLQRFMEFLTKECALRQEMYRDAADEADLQKLAKINDILVGNDSAPPGEPMQEVTMTPVSVENDDEDMEDMSPRKPGRETQWWGQNLTVAAFDQTAYDARVRDEESSRGRTSSRWWETSGEGGSISDGRAVRSDGLGDDESGCGFPRRSARYSKTPRASLREIAEFVTSPRQSGLGELGDNPAAYLNSARFPPDRKQHVSTSRSRSRAPTSRTRNSPPRRAVKTSLDIAPLLTLLPSYPLPYPAANNSHPDLEVFRTLVRTLSQLDGLKALHTSFAAWSKTHHATASAAAATRRNAQAERVQALYTHTPPDFAAIEASNAAFEAHESSHRAATLKAEFDEFTRAVVDPAHRDLHERITAASAAYVDLHALITAPPAPDDTAAPELLEKLTAAKWIFDVRETLHRHTHDLLSARNDRWRALVLAPLATPAAAADAVAFFDADTASRNAAFAADRAARTASFQQLVKTQVTAAVERARSTYWDTAPLVAESLAQIPAELTGVTPIVPPEEYCDEPEFLTRPLRYLEVKLRLAEGSVYALIERQTELLCLEHAVMSLETGEDVSKGGIGEGERRRSGTGGRTAEREGREGRLTEELKERVRTIEDEWKEGLGAVFAEVRERVEAEVERLAV